MPRELSARDLQILKVLAPECSEITCTSSGIAYRSILPPVAQHFATDAEDFRARISRLDDTDLEYLVECIRDGRESLGCIPPDRVKAFVERVAERIGFGPAEEVIERYVESRECEDVPLPHG
ncbi:hypothetical protein J2741_001672 [Methanolinea mesophila]|uniref:hypothetical protein n=1 Tax=Methanolinea mesophila TaxID=547055 RepID=UPI001AE4ABB5|nr:hypothetical protein [Methanolinea mesophila]MBP1929125.1 hypothetical protein [Methanolinea mesophila]